MPLYVASSLNTEVSGLLMKGIIGGMQEDLTPLLEKHRIPEVELDEWYQLQPFLDLFREMSEGASSNMFNFVSIGMSIVEHADFPPDVTELQGGLDFLNVIYHSVHRNESEDKGWRLTVENNNTLIAHCYSPYPHDLEYGIAYATAKRFCPPGKHFVVETQEYTDDHRAYRIILSND